MEYPLFVAITGPSSLVDIIKAAVRSTGVIPVDDRTLSLAQLTIELHDITGEVVVFDSVDSDHERELFKHIRALAGQVTTQDAGGNRQTDKVVIGVPSSPQVSTAVVQGIVRALSNTQPDAKMVAQKLVADELPELLSRVPHLAGQVIRMALPFVWKMIKARLGLAVIVLALAATPAFAQTSEVTVVQGGNSAVVTAAGEIQVNCTTGCSSGGTQDVNIIKYLGTAMSATNPIHVTPGTGAVWAVTGTFWQATQPVSGTFWQATQPISAASLPLPTGASTESTLATLNGKVTTASALPGLTDPGAVVRVIPEERVSTGALDHLGAVVNISVKGFQSWGGSIDAGTCTCTIVAETSNDDGATYVSALVFSDTQQATQWVMSSPNGSVTAEFLPTGKTTNAQLRVSAYTSGSATARLRAAAAQTATGVGALSSGIPSLPAPFFRTLIGGADGSGNAQSVVMIDSAPSGTEQGLVTRNVPSGTQTISGTVTANAGTNLNTSALALDSTVAKDASLTTLDTDVKANVTLHAGTNIVGKLGIDQTTPGTTNGVQVNAALPTGTNSIGQVTTNAGTNTSTANLDVALSTRLKPADTLAGVTTVTAVTAITNALPTGSNVIGHVINDSGSTTAVTGNVATTAADGSNVTLGAKADAKSTATDTTAVSEMSVLKEISAMEQAPASRAVTNVGTFAVQATLQANSGVDIGKLTANQSTNVAQVAGTTTDTNSGTKSAGTLRVVLATDQPALTNKLLVTPDSVALPANQSVNLSQVAGTTTDTNSGTKSAGTIRVVLATDQPALTNKLLVTPDSVALPANQSVNVNQLAGTTTDTNSGNKSAGTMRVVLATDQPALTNKLLVTPDSVALPANQSVNVNQFGGSAVATGTGASGSGVPRVTVANDSNVLVTPPTLTKGSQGSTGFSVQNLYDAGRARVSFTADRVTPAASDTLVTFVKNVSGTATTGQTTYTVSNGKTFRVTSIYVGIANTSTVSANVRVALRENTGGTCAASSAAVAMLQVAAGNIAANEGADGSLAIPDGWEFPAADSVCISAIGVATTETLTVTVMGYEY